MNKKPDDLIEKYERKKKKIEKKNKKLKERYILVKDKWEIDTKDFVKEIEKFIEHVNKDIEPGFGFELMVDKDDMYIAVVRLNDHIFSIKYYVTEILRDVVEEITVFHGKDPKDFKPHEIEKAKKLFLKLLSDFRWEEFKKDYGEF